MIRWLEKSSPIGMDIGSTALRAVQLSRGGSHESVQAALEMAYPPALLDLQHDPSADPEKAEALLKEIILKLMERGHFSGREVSLHCPAERLDMRPVTLPCGRSELDRNTTMNALKCHLDGHLEFALDKAVIDYKTIEVDPKGGGQKMIVYSADGEWIARRIKLLESIGLQCRGLDALPEVLFRLRGMNPDNQSGALNQGENEDGQPAEQAGLKTMTVILDVGYQGSTLITASDRGPFLCRRFALGGKKITESLGDAMMLSEAESELMKVHYGLTPGCQKNSLYLETGGAPASGGAHTTTWRAVEYGVMPLIKDFLEGMIRTLNYVITEKYDLVLEKVYLTGGGSGLAGLNELFSRELGIPVVPLAHPLLDQLTSMLSGRRAHPGQWATALGLAMI